MGLQGMYGGVAKPFEDENFGDEFVVKNLLTGLRVSIHWKKPILFSENFNALKYYVEVRKFDIVSMRLMYDDNALMYFSRLNDVVGGNGLQLIQYLIEVCGIDVNHKSHNDPVIFDFIRTHSFDGLKYCVEQGMSINVLLGEQDVYTYAHRLGSISIQKYLYAVREYFEKGEKVDKNFLITPPDYMRLAILKEDTSDMRRMFDANSQEYAFQLDSLKGLAQRNKKYDSEREIDRFKIKCRDQKYLLTILGRQKWIDCSFRFRAI